MPLTLLVEEGRAALEISDSKGECFAYLYTVLAHTPTRFSVRLTCREGGTVATSRDGRERVYVVAVGVNGGREWWMCSCPQARFRWRECEEKGGCKHAKTSRALWEVLEEMEVEKAVAPSVG